MQFSLENYKYTSNNTCCYKTNEKIVEYNIFNKNKQRKLLSAAVCNRVLDIVFNYKVISKAIVGYILLDVFLYIITNCAIF